jgi:transcriptional regulator with XRE-family HTH domain
MPRPSKAAHVLAKLREELGLHQKELAERVGLHWRTIQDIERGKTQLSRRNAFKISEKTGVDPVWLLANDPSRPMTTIDGRPWSQKDRKLFGGWGQEKAAFLRQMLAASYCPTLLQDYLYQRVFFDELALTNPDAFLRWRERLAQAWLDFVGSQPELAEHARKTPHQGLSQEALRSIRDDLDVIEDLQVTMRNIIWEGAREKAAENKPESPKIT